MKLPLLDRIRDHFDVQARNQRLSADYAKVFAENVRLIKRVDELTVELLDTQDRARNLCVDLNAVKAERDALKLKLDQAIELSGIYLTELGVAKHVLELTSEQRDSLNASVEELQSNVALLEERLRNAG